MRILCPASPTRPLLRFAALAQPGMINETIVAEMDALQVMMRPAGGPLVTRATARARQRRRRRRGPQRAKVAIRRAPRSAQGPARGTSSAAAGEARGGASAPLRCTRRRQRSRAQRHARYEQCESCGRRARRCCRATPQPRCARRRQRSRAQRRAQGRARGTSSAEARQQQL